MEHRIQFILLHDIIDQYLSLNIYPLSKQIQVLNFFISF